MTPTSGTDKEHSQQEREPQAPEDARHTRAQSPGKRSAADGTGHSPPGPAATSRPKNLAFMVGWLVFLGVYQIFLAWKFGTFFEGKQGDLRHYFGAGTMEPLYIAIGVLALVVAWGGWRLRPWAYRLAWVFQGLVFAVVLGGIIARIAGKPAPLAWLLLDTAFGAYNVWWLLQPGTRRAFAKPTVNSDPGTPRTAA